MNYLTAFLILLSKKFNGVILMETNRIIKGPDLDFGDFLQFIGIWMLMKSNPGTNRVDYLRENPIDIFSECSIFVNQFIYGKKFESIFSDLNFTATPPPPFLSR